LGVQGGLVGSPGVGAGIRGPRRGFRKDSETRLLVDACRSLRNEMGLAPTEKVAATAILHVCGHPSEKRPPPSCQSLTGTTGILRTS
jgi:hypothetical protein